MIMIPGLDSTEEELRSTEDLFLERGIATFSVDSSRPGEADCDLGVRGDWEVPGGAIIDYLITEPSPDPSRIGVRGIGSAAGTTRRGSARVPATSGNTGLHRAVRGPFTLAANWDNLPEPDQDSIGCGPCHRSPRQARVQRPATCSPWRAARNRSAARWEP